MKLAVTILLLTVVSMVSCHKNDDPNENRCTSEFVQDYNATVVHGKSVVLAVRNGELSSHEERCSQYAASLKQSQAECSSVLMKYNPETSCRARKLSTNEIKVAAYTEIKNACDEVAKESKDCSVLNVEPVSDDLDVETHPTSKNNELKIMKRNSELFKNKNGDPFESPFNKFNAKLN